MKLCMVGLGSIGVRHIKNINKILKERNLSFEIDALRSSNKPISKDVQAMLSREYYKVEDLPDDYDVIFITNPTSLHFTTIQVVINKSKGLFIEKPLFEKYDYELAAIPITSDGIYYIACPLRYSPVIKYIKNIINTEEIYSVRAISSSYLPDWRKGIDYRTTYSSKKEQGGGVSLDLIHEWDYIINLFGIPKEIYNIRGKYSNLDIDSDDLSIYIAKYDKKLVELHLDYIGRNPVRTLELYCKDYVIYADILHNTIEWRGLCSKKIDLDREDMYYNEMTYFVDIVLEGKNNVNDMLLAYQTLTIALGGALR